MDTQWGKTHSKGRKGFQKGNKHGAAGRTWYNHAIIMLLNNWFQVLRKFAMIFFSMQGSLHVQGIYHIFVAYFNH